MGQVQLPYILRERQAVRGSIAIEGEGHDALSVANGLLCRVNMNEMGYNGFAPFPRSSQA